MASTNGTQHHDFKAVAIKLLDLKVDLKNKLQCLLELKELSDTAKDAEYGVLLQVVWPALRKLLAPEQATFVKDSSEQKLRYAVLDLIHRLPHNDAFMQYANEVMQLLIKLLRVDNEEIGTACIKLVIDITRMYKQTIETNMRDFLNVVHEMYKNGAIIVNEIFADPKQPCPHFPRDDDKTIPRSIYSFKVLVECPIAVVIALQTFFKNGMNEVAREYLPDVINFMAVQAAPQKAAHEAAAMRGDRQLGMTDNIPTKLRPVYLDFVNAQIKSMSFLAYVIRAQVEDLRKYETQIPEICVRLLQDIPRESAAVRRELLIAIRHIFNTEFRVNFKTQIDAFLDERIVIGMGATAVQYLRPLGYSMLADLVHHVRAELKIEQIEKVLVAYTVIWLNPALGPDVITVCAKLLLNLVESLVKCPDKQRAGRLLIRLVESIVQKLKHLELLHTDIAAVEADPDGTDLMSPIAVERIKPFAGAGFVQVPLSDAKKDTRYLIRLLMHGLRAVLQGMRALEAPSMDASMMGPLFEGFVRCMGFFNTERAESREEKELLEWLAITFFEMEPHVVQEVWMTHMDFFFEQTKEDAQLLALLYKLTNTDRISHQMISILLRYLVDRYPTLGDQDRASAQVTLKLFKACYQATAQFPQQNEKVLQRHLAKLILDTFPFAAKAAEPLNYFLNLRNLFRAIGGGRFEVLYGEVLPILQEMLEAFNQFIDFVDPIHQDLIVELALTVPVRLTHLLPHLGLLVKPLVAGLNAGPEIVSQALRTLELCVDNLTAEFLEPIIKPAHSELMAGIHQHLKPSPYDAKLSHVCARILGKLGGRNRRLPELRVPLDYRSVGEDASITVAFDGTQRQLDIGHAIELASKSVQNSNELYRKQAFDFLKEAVAGMMQKAVQSTEQILRFEQALKGLFIAVKMEDLRTSAVAYIRDMLKHLFEEESKKRTPSPSSSRRFWGNILTCVFDAIAQSFACVPSDERDEVLKMVKQLLDDLGDWKTQETPDGPYNKGEAMAFVAQLTTRFIGLCYHAKWFNKLAGFTGITLLTARDDFAEYVQDRQIDMVQALLSVLKETPYGAPQYVNRIVDTILFVVRAGHIKEPDAKTKFMTGVVMLRELSSSIAEVRQAAQSVLNLYAELEEQPVSQLIGQHRDRLLLSIYQKPLRALPFPIQIGHIEAMTYCLQLTPPLVEVNEELWRLLGEALALADAEDGTLVGKTPQKKNIGLVSQLRVACIRLLTASMGVTDFMAKQTQTRQRVTGLYFKSLYSASHDIKAAAYDGLKLVLQHQNKLPKDTLQAGLKPILMNLADARRLTVPNLEGLARLLELLTNYFKVEIGVKLIDHFRVIADAQMLTDSAQYPLSDNEEIKKLVRLVNVFHLLPQTANVFLEHVLPLVVQTETTLRASGPTPFTEPLAKYLERFPEEAFEQLIQNVENMSYVRTVRACLTSGFAPSLQNTLNRRLQQVVNLCFAADRLSLLIPGLLLCRDMINANPAWLHERPQVFQVIIRWWRDSAFEEYDATAIWPTTRAHQASITMDILMTHLEHEPSPEVLVDLTLAFTRKVAVDISNCGRFIYNLLRRHTSPEFKSRMLAHTLVMLDDQSLSLDHKTSFLRIVINPMLYLSLNQLDAEEFVDAQFIAQAHATLWHKLSTLDTATFQESETPYAIEVLQFSTSLMRLAPNLMTEARKDIIKCGWNHISSDDIILKQTAYVLLAQFLELFDSPARIVQRVWAGLVRTHTTEGRALTKRALDILAPALPKRKPATEGGAHANWWAKNTRRVLTEEASSVSQLTSVYQLILRHANLFFDSRELFVNHMVHSLFKLGIAASATTETRTLAVETAELVIRWERQSLSESVGGYRMPVQLKETVVSFLVRFICTAQESISAGGLVGKMYNLLTDVLKSPEWQDVHVVLSFFMRNLVQTDYSTETATTFRNNAVVLAAVVERRPAEWFRSQATALLDLLRKPLLSDDTILHESLTGVVDRMFDFLPEPPEEQEESEGDTNWYTWAQETIVAGITSVAGLQGALFLLRSWARHRPEKVDALAPPLANVMGKLARAHVAINDSASATMSADARSMRTILELFQDRLGPLGEPRRLMFNILSGIVDKSNSQSMCRAILDMVRKWIFERTDGSPPLKDIAVMLHKVMSLETKGDDALRTQYYSIIRDIFLDQSLHRTDLTVRLEGAFFTGTRLKDPALRNEFLDLLDNTLPRSLMLRMQYVFASVSWDHIADSYWVHQALDLVLGATDDIAYEQPAEDDMDIDQPVSEFAAALGRRNSAKLVSLLRRLAWLDANTTHIIWVGAFRSFWLCLSRRAQSDMLQLIVTQLGQQYHRKQVGKQPNVPKTLLAGLAGCSPPIALPPHLIKYIGKSFNAWYDAIEQLQMSLGLVKDDDGFQENTLDSLAELYAELQEEDMFYGVWRRRALHWETNVAMSFQQNGLWKEAITIYENAQLRAKNTTHPSTEAEHSLWEDHWLLGSQKLGQWEILWEYSRSVQDPDLILECAWRTQDWTADREPIERALEAVSDTPTPRHSVFETYLSILKAYSAGTPDVTGFNVSVDRAVQLALRKWVALPVAVSAAHVPLLHHFQQLVELQESQQIFHSIQNTQASNLEKKSGELKVILQGWRERLPNPWDDIQIWSDLVAWRQHMFTVINKAYLPLIAAAPNAGTATANNNTFGYRGYHEMAWIINRFAHVARKHELWDLCHTSLTKIYTLPNIEISEAFLKLREQAKCHLQRRELAAGLEVINNTNLIYFSAPQKAEFFTMKGMFIAAAGGMDDEAYSAFSQAVKTDFALPKAWCEWGKFCDRLYRVRADTQLGAHAVTSYLQAAMMFKNAKARPLLARILWLLRVDDPEGRVGAAFDNHRGDYGFWWWIHLIPQLLMSLAHKEARQARNILLQLAKFYPQALFFQLRTMRDEEALARRQRDAQAQARAKIANAQAHAAGMAQLGQSGDAGQSAQPLTLINGTTIKEEGPAANGISSAANQANATPSAAAAQEPRQPWQYVDEITSILKTAFPLLALTMESMSEQFVKGFKTGPEEELLRYLQHMVMEALSGWAGRSMHPQPGGDPVPPSILQHMHSFAPSLPEGVNAEFKRDFLDVKVNLREYLSRITAWRDKYDMLVDRRPKTGGLDSLSHHLAEFQHSKFDDIEVPGQYLKFENTNGYFVKILRFKSQYETTRAFGGTFKRVTIMGTNGVDYGFTVHQGTSRGHRREERLTQLFRILGSAVETRKESMKRGISFYIPGVVPLSSNVRLIEHKASVISFQDISDEYMAKRGWTKEHTILSFADKMRETSLALGRQGSLPDRLQLGPLRLGVYDEIQTKLMSDNVMLNYFIRTYPHKKDLWSFRKQFTVQTATTQFLTYVFSLSHRIPNRFYVDRITGNIFMTEQHPVLTLAGPKANESTPFRLTPNLQRFITKEGVEGILPSALLCIARALAAPEYDLDMTLLLFMRDEVSAWQQQSKGNLGEPQIMAIVSECVKGITEKVDLLSCKMERNKGAASSVPVFQTIIDLIGTATNPLELAKMSELSMPWF
ncbi:FAT-domain-containing protein [Calocera viscosa TUFC12733]|uniref:FAT-domain-containing protein n=1 Tax=Calocera viscosa (strain TUFC12733) TaxID=1330018 RepID=A0A167QMW6_CALVF|nr:FAT-domain-containing protein [Calocera viscosa TUFC12733]